jgi:PAS domain S-box-containing protein
VHTHGLPAGAVIIVHDVTRREEISRAVAGEAEQFRLFVSQVREYAVFGIAPDRRLTSWNAGVLHVLGFDEDEFIGRRADILFTPEDRAAGVVDRELHDAIATGRSMDDRWMLRASGERFFASGMTSAVRDEDGRLLGFTKVMRDMTDRKLAEEALRTRWRVFDGGPGGRSATQTMETPRASTSDTSSEACMRVLVISTTIGRSSTTRARMASASSSATPLLPDPVRRRINSGVRAAPGRQGADPESYAEKALDALGRAM